MDKTMVSVPVKPTEAMIEAAQAVDNEMFAHGSMHGADANQTYAAMIAAAPAPQPVQGEAVQIAAPGDIELATQFHEVYERLAPSFGYETRTETRRFDPTSPNGRLMVAVCGEISAALRSQEPAYGPDGSMSIHCQQDGCQMYKHPPECWSQGQADGVMDWSSEPPKESGWYWHDDRDVMRLHFVFTRPGHAYLCTEGEPYGSGQKRNFQAVQRMGGLWSGKVNPPTRAALAQQANKEQPPNT